MQGSFLAKRGNSVAIAILAMANAMAQSTGSIKEIVVRGNKNISVDAITVVMRSQPGRPLIQADLVKDEDSIRDLGWFKDVTIFSRNISGDEWQVLVEVQENPVIKEVRVTGNTAIKTEKLLPLITQQVGQVFNLRTVAPSVQKISALYQEGGFFAQADIQPLEDSPETLNVQVIERVVNDIVLTGLTRTRPSVVKKLIKTRPGKAFNENTWDSDLRRLYSTFWFKDITPDSKPTDQIGRFDLLMDFEEDRTGLINFGAALDPRSRLAGNIRYSDSNWRGTGQTLSAGLQQDTAGTGLSASIDYVNPYMDSRDTSLAVRAFSRINSYFTGSGIGATDSPDSQRFDERRTGASVAVSKIFRDIYSLTYGASFERIETLKLRTNTATDFIQQDGDLVVLNAQFARDRRDVIADPAEGDYARIAIEPAFANISKIGGNVGDVTDVLGKNTFFRTTLEYKAFFSQRPKDPEKRGKPRKVLAVRARYGSIIGTAPFFEQLFMGGSDSLRGYSDQRFWGKQSFLSSVEYRVPIQDNFRLIGFADYGGAWGGYGTLNNFAQSKSLKLNLGYGVGAAFKAGPLGLIRIDFGFNEKGQNRTHFSIGANF